MVVFIKRIFILFCFAILEVLKLKMFKFDFNVEEVELENTFVDISNVAQDKKSFVVDGSQIAWYESEEIDPSKECLENIDICKLNSVKKDVTGVKITHMISGFLLEDIKDNDSSSDLDIKKAEQQHSDLIPGVYEGGAKIWECTDDLLTYLSHNFTIDKLNNIRVLDLGCGSGLLGIYAFLSEAKVTFQDYNKDVLEKITIPNVLLNTIKTVDDEHDEEFYDFNMLKERSVRFFSGDWTKWSQLTQKEEPFDIILTAETIYNPDNQQKLLNCIHDKLKPEGLALVAAKTYYFGVGGGLRQFEQLVDKDKRFTYKTVWLSTEGVNREIIELKKVI